MTEESLKVLYVDHNKDMREMVSAFLGAHGFDVETFDGGPSLIDRIARDTTCAAIITDLEMPDMDGLDVLDHVRMDVRHENTVVIVFTSKDEVETMTEVESSGGIYVKRSGSLRDSGTLLIEALQRHLKKN